MKFIAYGLVWEAAYALPFTPADDDAVADVHVRFDANRPERIETETLTRTLARTPIGFCLRMEAPDSHWADFSWVRGDQSLTITTSRAISECWPALVGVIPAILLRDRGQTILHGAVMAIGGAGIAVLGDAGMGKSTLSARLIGRGAAVATDDLIILSDTMVERGYTDIGLLPETAAALGVNPASRVGIRSGDGKIQVRAKTRADQRTPLAAIIVLSDFDPALTVPTLHRQNPIQAIRHIRANLYGGWIGSATKDDAVFCLRLAAEIPVYTLSRPANLDQLDAACTLIEPLASQDESGISLN
jgi:hypothetical protein